MDEPGISVVARTGLSPSTSDQRQLLRRAGIVVPESTRAGLAPRSGPMGVILGDGALFAWIRRACAVG